MGSAPGAARLLSLHMPWYRVPAGARRHGRNRDPSRGWIFPPAGPPPAERATILFRRHPLARLHSRRPVAGSARALDPVPGFPGPGPQLHARIYMHRKKIVLIVLIVTAGWLALAAQAHEFSGARAMDYARKAVAFGPRPPGSAALRNLRAYILAQLKLRGCEVTQDGLLRGCEVTQDGFTGHTPGGPVAMVNIIARFPAKSGRAVVLTGHYDTKKMAGMRFVGADDGGSSTAFLLEMAETLQGMPHNDDI